jgi:hypothetical protein
MWKIKLSTAAKRGLSTKLTPIKNKQKEKDLIKIYCWMVENGGYIIKNM